MPVLGDERRVLGDRLRDKEVVERVAMVHRQIAEYEEVSDLNPEQDEPAPFGLRGNSRNVDAQLAGANLNDGFPEVTAQPGMSKPR